MVGGRAPQVENEQLYRFIFPERPGALMNFLSNLRSDWNISLFHYRNHGSDFGRVLVGMQVPPNYGRQYGESFAALFATVAKAEGAALVPFLLKGVADVPDSEALFQPDRIHPREAAHPIMLGNVWPVLRPLLPGR